MRQSNSVQPKKKRTSDCNDCFEKCFCVSVSLGILLKRRKYNVHVTSGQRILSLSHRDNLIQTLTMNIKFMHYGYSWSRYLICQWVNTNFCLHAPLGLFGVFLIWCNKYKYYVV